MSEALREIKKHIAQGCFALHYDWETRKIKPIATEDDYFQQLFALKEIGKERFIAGVTRSEPLSLGKGQPSVHLYMASYGDYRRNKFVHGENKLAQALGKCLFDYVFVFPETTEFAKEKCLFRIKENLEINLVKTHINAKLLSDSYERLFGECKELKRLQRLLRTTKPRDQDEVEYTD